MPAAAANRDGPVGFVLSASMGAVAGATSKTVVAPVERIRLLMQMASTPCWKGHGEESGSNMEHCQHLDKLQCRMKPSPIDKTCYTPVPICLAMTAQNLHRFQSEIDLQYHLMVEPKCVCCMELHVLWRRLEL